MYNIPLPLVTYDKPYIVFTLPFTDKSHALEGLNSFEQKVWEYIKLNPDCKRADIQKYLDAETKATERAIKVLLNQNKIVKCGKARATTYKAE